MDDLDCEIASSAINRLRENNPNLPVVSFFSCYIDLDDDHALQIIDALKSNSVITSLFLARFTLRDPLFASLADVLSTNSHLTTLDFSEFPLSPACASCLCDALQRNTSLTSLSLSLNSHAAEPGARAQHHADFIHSHLQLRPRCGSDLLG